MRAEASPAARVAAKEAAKKAGFDILAQAEADLTGSGAPSAPTEADEDDDDTTATT